jgi:FtsH-binding integral membrane protein
MQTQDRDMPIYGDRAAVAEPLEARRAFIQKTYAHLVGAILAFIGLEVLLFKTGLAESIATSLFGMGRFGIIGVMIAFVAAGWIAQRLAESHTSPAMQYLGLTLYVVAEAFIFVPLLYLAAYASKDPNIIPMAGLYTGIIFGGLTAVVMVTKKDFSFLRGALAILTFGAVAVVICAVLFGFSLGIVFSGAMVVLMAGWILYHTSNILHHYPVGAHVAAALNLFAAIATLFWYILRILMDRR